MKIDFIKIFLFLLLIIQVGCQKSQPSTTSRARFAAERVDEKAPTEPWGKSVGDIDGDGRPDLVVGGHAYQKMPLLKRLLAKVGILPKLGVTGRLVWYRHSDSSSQWEPQLISDKHAIRTDLEIKDIDQDGKNDVVAATDEGVIWFKNPDWSETQICPFKMHDVEVADLDGDGDFDVTVRDQSLFGHNNGDSLFLYEQVTPSQWKTHILIGPPGEGLKVQDVDGDQKPDLVVNRVWFQNPGSFSVSAWRSKTYSSAWTWNDVAVDVGDINGDGRPDIAASPAEEVGGRYHISWFEAPTQGDSLWVEHLVDSSVESDHHSLSLRDFDNDGDLDIATAEMNQGADPDEIKVYWNTQEMGPWKKELISTEGSHNMRALDIDGDFDIDLMGADWKVEGEEEGSKVTLWRNNASPPSNWKRHVIDSERPGNALFIDAFDVDGDGNQDVISGGFWYQSKGRVSDLWQRHSLGGDAQNFLLGKDLDGDGDTDLIATSWSGYEWIKPPLYRRILKKLGLVKPPPLPKTNQILWCENQGKGLFATHLITSEGAGDFPQGVAFANVKNSLTLLVSWHKTGVGIQSMTVPKQRRELWPTQKLTDSSQDEALSIGDIDRDGDEDILTGTKWLRQQDTGWESLILQNGRGNPDRNRLADINGDGRLDAVVGYEAISKPGLLAWYEQPSDLSQPWKEVVVDHPIGPMSLDVADMDGDGDLDWIVGEHNLKHPETARLMWYENQRKGLHWQGHLISTGDEHHEGAKLVDIDADGDLDILSIGWGHGKILLFENPGNLK